MLDLIARSRLRLRESFFSGKVNHVQLRNITFIIFMYRHAARRIDTFRCHIWNKWSLQKSNFKIRSITSQNGPGSNEATPDVKPSRVVATAFGLRLIAVPGKIPVNFLL